MNAQIISIGTELAIGQTVDTNAAWLAQQLAAHGVVTHRHVTISDDVEPIRIALSEAAEQSDLLLVTGGLGPTPDDVTREALAAAMDVELVFDQGCYDKIADYFHRRKREMHPENRHQAMIPRGAKPIRNAWGTAPGIHAVIGLADVYVMPGVPREMKAMFEQFVLPGIIEAGEGAVIVQRTLHSFGMAEAEIGEKIADLMQRGRNPAVGTSASDLIISIRINAEGDSHDAASKLAEADEAEIRARLGTYLFGGGDDTLAHAVARLLTEKKMTVSTAESCTGGLIAKRLTDVSGSSGYFLEGFVTYSNDAKHRLLGVPKDLIERHGAVSREVAEAMAAGCRAKSKTDFAIAVTGIAGPTGETEDKPIGLVFLALASKDGVTVKEARFGNILTREEVRDRAAKAALNMLRIRLIDDSRV